jgi:hypothetical protein
MKLFEADSAEDIYGNELSNRDYDSVAFFKFGDTFYIGKSGEIHSDIILKEEDIEKELARIKYELYNNNNPSNNVSMSYNTINKPCGFDRVKYQGVDGPDWEALRQFYKLDGRMWTDSNVITFWENETKEDIIKTIDYFNKDGRYKIDPKKWYIYFFDNNKDFTILLDEYLGSKYTISVDNSLKKQQHIESPLNKEKKFIKGFGSDSQKGRQSLKFKQALMKSEKMITKFNLFK